MNIEIYPEENHVVYNTVCLLTEPNWERPKKCTRVCVRICTMLKMSVASSLSTLLPYPICSNGVRMDLMRAEQSNATLQTANKYT